MYVYSYYNTLTLLEAVRNNLSVVSTCAALRDACLHGEWKYSLELTVTRWHSPRIAVRSTTHVEIQCFIGLNQLFIRSPQLQSYRKLQEVMRCTLTFD